MYLKSSLLSLSIVGSFIVAGPVFAQSAEEKGLALAKAASARDTGWGNMTSQMEMILENRAGKTSTRKLENRTLEVEGDGDKTLSLFKEPRDVQGTAMLTFTHGIEADDQWLYLPAIKRVKRISSKNRSGPFMGSEFAFEDLGSQEIEKYTYKYLRDEACGNGMECTVNERYPAYENSGYTRQTAWVDKAEYRTIKIDYFDRKDSLLKTLTMSDYHEYNGYWRASTFLMENHQNGKKTILNWRNFKFGTGLTDRDFNKNTLKRLL